MDQVYFGLPLISSPSNFEIESDITFLKTRPPLLRWLLPGRSYPASCCLLLYNTSTCVSAPPPCPFGHSDNHILSSSSSSSNPKHSSFSKTARFEKRGGRRASKDRRYKRELAFFRSFVVPTTTTVDWLSVRNPSKKSCFPILDSSLFPFLPDQ